MGTNAKRRKDKLLNGQNGVCEKCRCVFAPGDLTFHHVIPTRHIKGLRELMRGTPKSNNPFHDEQIYALLCRKCHRDIEIIYDSYDSLETANEILELHNKAMIDENIIYESQLSSTDFNTYRILCKRFKLMSRHKTSIEKLYRRTSLFYLKIYTYFLEDKIRPIKSN